MVSEVLGEGSWWSLNNRKQIERTFCEKATNKEQTSQAGNVSTHPILPNLKNPIRFIRFPELTRVESPCWGVQGQNEEIWTQRKGKPGEADKDLCIIQLQKVIS